MYGTSVDKSFLLKSFAHIKTHPMKLSVMSHGCCRLMTNNVLKLSKLELKFLDIMEYKSQNYLNGPINTDTVTIQNLSNNYQSIHAMIQNDTQFMNLVLERTFHLTFIITRISVGHAIFWRYLTLFLDQ